MNVETVVKLDKFQARFYQLPILDSIENKGYKRVLAVLPRRAGKDLACWNLMIRQALKRIGIYWYIFPTYAQGKKILWDGMTNDGFRLLDYIPKELVGSMNSQEMKIKLVNGSLIQVIGSDNVDSLVGSNPIGCVFSEYALQDPRAYQFIRPILTGNDGWAVFISTPRGKNSLWELWNIAQANKDQWFSYKMTVNDTQHIDMEEIRREVLSGELSEDLAQQEYYCSFDMGVDGAFYAKYIDKMRLNGQLGMVPWESSFKVNTAWDLGMSDSTVIIFYQQIGQTVRIIDYYEKNKEGLEHYAQYLSNKPYLYGKHFAPHDIAVREMGTGMTRLEKAKHLGIKFEAREGKSLVPNVSIMDGIESVRSSFGKIWIDETKCAALIKSLENYRQEYDAKRKVYKGIPLHDHNSHAADAMRYLCLSLSRSSDSLSAQELDARYRKAMHGEDILPQGFTNLY